MEGEWKTYGDEIEVLDSGTQEEPLTGEDGTVYSFMVRYDEEIYEIGLRDGSYRVAAFGEMREEGFDTGIGSDNISSVVEELEPEHFRMAETVKETGSGEVTIGQETAAGTTF